MRIQDIRFCSLLRTVRNGSSQLLRSNSTVASKDDCSVDSVNIGLTSVKHGRQLVDLIVPYDIPGLTKIRLGRENDGGYVVADELIGEIDHIISSEGSGDISFEYDFMRINKTCDMVNYNGSRHYDDIGSRFRFINKKIDGYNSVASAIVGLKNVLLKLDIEGDEYDAFRVSADRFPDLSGVNMLVIELHNTMSKSYLSAVAFLSLVQKHMTLFHVHANDYGGYTKFGRHDIPNVVELTFVNNALASGKTVSVSQYPVHGVDMCNRREAEDRPLTYISDYLSSI